MECYAFIHCRSIHSLIYINKYTFHKETNIRCTLWAYHFRSNLYLDPINRIDSIRPRSLVEKEKKRWNHSMRIKFVLFFFSSKEDDQIRHYECDHQIAHAIASHINEQHTQTCDYQRKNKIDSISTYYVYLCTFWWSFSLTLCVKRVMIKWQVPR